MAGDGEIWRGNGVAYWSAWTGRGAVDGRLLILAGLWLSDGLLSVLEQYQHAGREFHIDKYMYLINFHLLYLVI